ncbi:hypothetical protein [Iodidimonas sp. SYSU 1G8]|uniref:hypothetical protein n=1 Tax=Iodidimonas sp. SYSU 1G8 TaxID=3133967 RepID=UPI0031FF3E69
MSNRAERLTEREYLCLRLAWLGDAGDAVLYRHDLTRLAFRESLDRAALKLRVASACEAVVAAVRLGLIGRGAPRRPA